MTYILLVEDDRHIRDIVELILHDAGHMVVSTRDGLSGLQLARQQCPDLILMDLDLPGLDGWEATRQLKIHPATQSIPVVAFTAHVIPEAWARAHAAGCVTIITKPFDIDGLIDQVAALLIQHTASEQHRAGDPNTTA